MESRPGQGETDHPASQVLGSDFELQNRPYTDETYENIVGLGEPFEGLTTEQLKHKSLGETALRRYAPQEESSTAGHLGHLVANHETSPVAAMPDKAQSDIEGCVPEYISDEKQMSLVYRSSCVAGLNPSHYLSNQPNTQRSLSPYMAVDIEDEALEQAAEPRKDTRNPAGFTHFPYRLSSRRPQKAVDECQDDAPQLAEDVFAQVKFWREVFSALIGMHGVYVLANFAFDNPAGGICSLFCFLCSAFAQLDRRAPSYFLTALLSFCLGVVIAVSLSTPVRGFEMFSENKLLRKICMTQVCLLLLETPVALVVALRIMKLHSFLREPGVLIPLQCLEKAGTAAAPISGQHIPEAAESSGNAFQTPFGSVTCASPVGPLENMGTSSECDETAH